MSDSFEVDSFGTRVTMAAMAIVRAERAAGMASAMRTKANKADEAYKEALLEYEEIRRRNNDDPWNPDVVRKEIELRKWSPYDVEARSLEVLTDIETGTAGAWKTWLNDCNDLAVSTWVYENAMDFAKIVAEQRMNAIWAEERAMVREVTRYTNDLMEIPNYSDDEEDEEPEEPVERVLTAQASGQLNEILREIESTLYDGVDADEVAEGRYLSVTNLLKKAYEHINNAARNDDDDNDDNEDDEF
tara:strand:+ start:701 stop:1435 length:735 start_codon:yes stop_codon:yes gene_type:complete